MSVKKIKKTSAPTHDQSLLNEEIIARSNLAIPKATRQKKKVIEDPSLGKDITKKILKTAVEQLEEHKETPEIDIHIPEGEEEEEFDNIELDLEADDEESRALFELFKPSIVEEVEKLQDKIESTSHLNDENAIIIYKQLGQLLRSYKSGRLPKAVNVVASTKIGGWYELLLYSKPHEWSINALHAVTVLFSQSASDKRFTKFLRNIVLENMREILEKSKKLPRNVWQALIAASKRPSCFINGILDPLSKEIQCSQKEARVISAIISRIKIPRDHVNAFIIKLVEEKEINVTRTIFVARFVQKGQGMAIRTIDAIFAYFMQFTGETETQPVLWHKALLDFVKHYGKELLDEQKEALFELIQRQHHHSISAEIKKVLTETPSRNPNDRVEEYVPILE